MDSRANHRNGTHPEDIASPPQAPVIIRFVGKITFETVTAVAEALHRKVSEGRTDITLAMKSPGGNAMAGLWLAHQIEQLPISLTTHNRTFVESAAVDPYLRGKRRLVEPNATFLLHPPKMPEDERKKFLAMGMPESTGDTMVDFHSETTIQTLMETTQMTRDRAVALCGKESVLTAAEAQKEGIAHEIQDIIIPQGAEVIDVFFFEE